MRIRSFLAPLATIGVLTLPGAALAAVAALVVGNAEYDQVENLNPASAVIDAAEALREAGVDAEIVQDGNREEIVSALRQLEQKLRQADGALVVLSGRFVSSRDETWFLPAEAEGASLVDTAMGAIPVTTVMTLLSKTPGRAVLLLATELYKEDPIGAGMRRGLGSLDIPHGVTVIRSQPRLAGSILEETLAVPGASIKKRVETEKDAWVQGYFTRNMSFLPRNGAQPSDSGSGNREQQAWQRAQERNTEAAFVEFLDAYPDGRFTPEAKLRLAAVRAEPNRAARIVEDNLELERSARQEIQRNLVLLGFDTRGIDGVFGPGSRSAIAEWQRQNDRADTGFLDRGMIGTIDDQARRRAAELEDEKRERAEQRAAEERDYWRETGEGANERGLVAFLTRYPDGELSERAERRLRELRDGEITDNGISVREELLWEKAQRDDSLEAYTDYARAFPRGRHADQARQRISTLRSNQEDSGGDDETAARETEERLGLNDVTRRAVEQRLAAEGLDPGQVDGTFDGQTRIAIRRYQEQSQLPGTGYLNQITVVRLLADTVRRVLQ